MEIFFRKASLALVVFLCGALPNFASEDFMQSNLRILGLNGLHETRGDDEMVLRLIESHSDKAVAFQVEIKRQEEVLIGKMSVISRSRQEGSGVIANSRKLSNEETRRIVSVVNRREILFLPESFQYAIELKGERGGLYGVELYSSKLNVSKSIVRSFSESDSLEELRDWLVSIAHIKSKDWVVEREGGK